MNSAKRLLTVLGSIRKTWNPSVPVTGGALPSLWYKSDKLTLNDGDAVTSLVDQTANGNNAAQATEGNQPTFQNDAGSLIGTLPVVRFDGSDDFMSLTSQLTLGDYTIYYICKTGTSIDAVIGHSDTENGIQVRTVDSMRFRYSVGSNYDAASSITFAATTNYIFTITRATATTTVRANGSNILTFGAGDYAGASNNLKINRLCLAIGSYGLIDLAELIIYPAAHTAAQIAQVEAYLSSRSSIPLA